MKRSVTRSLICMFLVLVLGVGAYGLSIPASEDTTATDKKITLAASTAGNLAVDPTHVALVYFNLDDIPKDTVVRFARLRLYMPSIKDRGAGLGVHRVTTQWNESAESAQPSYTDMTIAKIDPLKLGSRRFVTVDVTGVVQSWIRMAVVNEGFALTSLAPASRDVAGASVTIASKEGAGLGFPAQLDIELASGGTQGAQGPAGPAGPQGPKGEPGVNGKSVLSGTVAPTSTTGVVGDFYLNAATGALYGPKTTTGWGTARSLVGPKGDTGAQGLKGNTGATGPQGPKGEKGNAGQVISIETGAITAEKLSADAIKSIVDAAVNAVKGTAGIVPGMVTVLGGTLPSGSDLAGQMVGDFQIGKYEVTWGEWKAVRDWALANGYTNLSGMETGNGYNYPVTSVGSNNARKWCNAKSEKEGKTPVYQVNGVTYKTGESEPTVQTSANGYRLPTEAEWEWAARGGRQTRGYIYSGGNDPTVNAMAWTRENSLDATHEVGTKAANELGIFDMSGNVWELCKGYPEGRGFPIRGGCWKYSVESCAVAFRYINGWSGNSGDGTLVGFRLACNWDMVNVVGGTLPDGSQLKGQVVGDFQIGKNEVTWREWKSVREWAVANGYTDLVNVGEGNGDNYPVTWVNSFDVLKWCNARSEKEGKTPVYQINGATYKNGESLPTKKNSANGYRLPTDAEWEWAARGGQQTHGYAYSGSDDRNPVAWYEDNSGGVTHEVGLKKANELGIFDMSGNVWEWCDGWDPGPQESGRVLRGGAWNNGCTLAFRRNRSPEIRYDSLGFRLACNSGQ